MAAKLRPISREDLQLIRYWRNLEHVREQMLVPKMISSAEHLRWFDTLDPDTCQHFIYSLDDVDIGSINLNRINNKQKTCEVGIFCGHSGYLTHWINVWASLQLYEYAFENLALERAFAVVLNHNQAALRFNHQLGFTTFNDKKFSDKKEQAQKLVLHKQQFKKNAAPLKRYLQQYCKA
ncbi:MAG: GNAT family N-acetyltransferase [Vibrionaceae bacterium]